MNLFSNLFLYPVNRLLEDYLYVCFISVITRSVEVVNEPPEAFIRYLIICVFSDSAYESC